MRICQIKGLSKSEIIHQELRIEAMKINILVCIIFEIMAVYNLTIRILFVESLMKKNSNDCANKDDGSWRKDTENNNNTFSENKRQYSKCIILWILCFWFAFTAAVWIFVIEAKERNEIRKKINDLFPLCCWSTFSDGARCKFPFLFLIYVCCSLALNSEELDFGTYDIPQE